MYEITDVIRDYHGNKNKTFQPYRITVKRNDMKKSDIKTLDDLKEFLTEYCKENPEDDCCELVRGICEENGWIYTDDSDLEYDWDDYAYDGKNLLSCDGGREWNVCKVEGVEMEYKGRDIIVREDAVNFYIKYESSNRGGFYPKADWELEEALEDHANTYEGK